VEPELDLHGYRKSAAIRAVTDYLEVQAKAAASNSLEQSWVRIITGTGSHSSMFGGPVLRTSVDKLLTKRQMEYQQDTPGSFLVNVCSGYEFAVAPTELHQPACTKVLVQPRPKPAPAAVDSSANQSEEKESEEDMNARKQPPNLTASSKLIYSSSSSSLKKIGSAEAIKDIGSRGGPTPEAVAHVKTDRKGAIHGANKNLDDIVLVKLSRKQTNRIAAAAIAVASSQQTDEQHRHTGKSNRNVRVPSSNVVDLDDEIESVNQSKPRAKPLPSLEFENKELVIESDNLSECSSLSNSSHLDEDLEQRQLEIALETSRREEEEKAKQRLLYEQQVKQVMQQSARAAAEERKNREFRKGGEEKQSEEEREEEERMLKEAIRRSKKISTREQAEIQAAIELSQEFAPPGEDEEEKMIREAIQLSLQFS